MNADRVDRFRRLVGSEFQTDRAMKLEERSPEIFKFRSGIFESIKFWLEDLRERDV